MLWAGTIRVPDTKHARNLAERFRKHGAAYFRFVTTPGIEPTNNLAEQAIRFVVIDRRITQGTRSEKGRRWCERIWTVIATCAQQGRGAFQFLLDSVQAYLSTRQTAFASAVRPLTTISLLEFAHHIRGGAITLHHTVNGYVFVDHVSRGVVAGDR